MGDVTKNGNAEVNGSDDEPESIVILDAGAQYGKVGPVRCSLFLTNYTVNNIILLPLSSAPHKHYIVHVFDPLYYGRPSRSSQAAIEMCSKNCACGYAYPTSYKLASKNLAI